ncbi:alpha/beta hydrolase [Streptomyces tsukubensis]|uniref:DUF1023 domain-containing protein n=1 Tax=Streptomyces tsukubensis TaxID=83656 RepID=A0A1V4A6L8_9ACTN|nr:alpha/beta hydrolase [Streptomyces tsukubensis]OON76664.1 hypothetical protein B1H18_20275 [Streptomyces tsukubensis]QFR93371.1 hypothetical protein GBW32_10080 [Streptomyces tsukubensis]
MRLGSRRSRGRRALLASALAATVVAATAGWATGQEQRAITGPPPGSAAWRADDSMRTELPDPAEATPKEVAAFFASLSPTRAHHLMVRHAAVVGNLDGAPVSLRFEANALALRAERSRQRVRAAAPDGTLQDHQRARSLVARYGELLAPGRRILAFDPRGRGQVAQVYGDLGHAEHVSVVVPGSDMDLTTFDRKKDPLGTPAGMARSLRTATGGRTAVVAWVGYTTPVGLGTDAATGRLAEAGAPRLARFTQGLTAVGAPRPEVFCHSYGSVVCGLAASKLEASDIVVLGSPGMRAERASDLGAKATVWAARDDSDWIGKVPHIELWGLGHGTDPTDKEFGARRIPAHNAHGHTGYFAPGTDSLRSFARIAGGEYS